jgi:hypothetical protein
MAMRDPGDDIDRAMARLLARLEPDELGRALVWAVTRSDAELERWGIELDDDGRLELIAWTLELARRCGPRP